MEMLPFQDITLNIRYDAPEELWQKIPSIYERMPGWIGFAQDGIPYWYSSDDSGKSKIVYASVEPGGLQIVAKMDIDEWERWIATFKRVASSELGFEVGDVQDGFI
jgi:hypothetical protein